MKTGGLRSRSASDQHRYDRFSGRRSLAAETESGSRLVIKLRLARPYRHAGGPAFGSESARLRGLRRAALAGAVRAPHCGRRRLSLNRSHSGRGLADRRVFDHSRISPVSPAHRVAFLIQPAMASGRQHRKTMTGRWAPLLTPAARAAVAKPVLARARPEAVAALLGLDG